MQTTIKVAQYRTLVRVAQACDPEITAKNRCLAKIEALQNEVDQHQKQIDAFDAGVRNLTGFPVEALIRKVIISGTDANGKPTKTTKYVPTDIVTYDEKNKEYIITTPGEEQPAEPVDKTIAPAETEETTAEPVNGDNALDW